MAEFVIRAGTIEDVAAVVALDRATESLPHWAAAQYEAVFAQPDGVVRRRVFVAETAAELVGFAVGMAALAGDEVIAELESVVVAVSARRMGVAKGLCKAVIGWARESGANEMELEVRSGSAGAIRLYEGLGFVEVGRRVGYYKAPTDDAVLMQAKLKNDGPSQG